MLRFHSLLLSTALLLGFTPLQNPPADREQKPTLSKAARLTNRKTIARMQGAWQLVQMKLADQASIGLGEVAVDNAGFCLVSGSYLSIELHVRGVSKGEEDKGRSFITGLHRFELGEDGSMETSTVIATRTNIEGLPEFEPPGTTRQYSIGLVGDSMTLTRADGHTLIFERLLDDRTRVDFFGRPVTEKDDASDDEDESGEKKEDDGDDDGNG